MTDFAEMMETNPPRLVVLFKSDEGEGEQFQWGVVGDMPLMSLIGAVVRAQVELLDYDGLDLNYRRIPDQQALVIAWDTEDRQAEWFAHEDVPVEAMVGMLEVIKNTLVAARQAQQAAPHRTVIQPPTGLIGPDGGPLRM